MLKNPNKGGARLIPTMVFDCKYCGKRTILGWHPIWKDRKICWDCRDKMYAKHKVWMDKLKDNYEKETQD